jgi:malonate decarboxylase gamma subunit
MTLDELLVALFGDDHDVTSERGVVCGTGVPRGGERVDVIGVADGIALGVDEALALGVHVETIIARALPRPLLVIVDSASQRMSKRDELLGLYEFLAHLAKCIIYADRHGHHTVGVLYGRSAAGAFLATALATRTLVALPGAWPEVMDLPSMAKVTQLPLSVLTEMAKATPVFAPGLDNLARTGAVFSTWDVALSLADQLQALLEATSAQPDERDRLGAARGGRLKAYAIAQRVYDLAMQRD